MARLDRTAAESDTPLPDVAFYRRTLQNLLVLETMKATEEDSERPSQNNVRDTAMADNLLWLANEWCKGKKLIVWAASFHGVREAESIETDNDDLDYHGLLTMGHAAYAEVGKDLYSIAFTAYEGKSGNPFFGSARLARSESGSLESLCHDAGHPYLFVDFRALPDGHWLRAPIVARPLGYSPMRATWPRHFDAMIYTARMFPSSRDGKPAK
jgi:erythromycin esterase